MRTIDTIGHRVQTRALRLRSPTSARRLMLIVIGLLDRMAERRRSRMALMELNDQQLKDIGLTRNEAWRESVRPFWD